MRYGIEAITLPVSDVDRAKEFYEQAGWHLDVDTGPAPGMRVVQFTPPGSDCSIAFGIGFPQSEPGSYVNTYLVVADIEPAHRELRERGIEISDNLPLRRARADAGSRSDEGRLPLVRELRRSGRQHLAAPGGAQSRLP